MRQKLPAHYKSVSKELRLLDYDRLDLERQRRHADPCDCDCDGCQDNCEGYKFEDNYEDMDDLEAQLTTVSERMVDLEQTKKRLERYAKFHNITLDTSKT